MAYRFKLSETLPEGVRRIAVEQLDAAVEGPEGEAGRVIWVHETRKSLKRVRSLLRAVRSGLEPAVWREENAALRDIARMLSGMRDRDVLGATMAKLSSGREKSLAQAMTSLSGELERRVAAPLSADRADTAAPVIETACQALREARGRLKRLDVSGRIDEVLAAGIGEGQRAGRRALAAFIREPTDEAQHELRKRVQTSQRQMTLVQAAWPEIYAARLAAAKALAQNLGDAQDLAVLAASIRSVRGTRRHGQHIERVLAACSKRQTELRRLVLPEAGRLYALPHKAAAVELQRCWQAASARTAG